MDLEKLVNKVKTEIKSRPVSTFREGFVTVSLGWIVLSLFGCMPFVISGEIPHIIDAII